MACVPRVTTLQFNFKGLIFRAQDFRGLMMSSSRHCACRLQQCLFCKNPIYGFSPAVVFFYAPLTMKICLQANLKNRLSETIVTSTKREICKTKSLHNTSFFGISRAITFLDDQKTGLCRYTHCQFLRCESLEAKVAILVGRST